MPAVIHIPRSNRRFGTFVPVSINGKLTKIPVGQDYVASDAELEILNRLEIPLNLTVVPDGFIQFPSLLHGSRITLQINGKLTIIPTDTPVQLTASQQAVVDQKGLRYLVGGTIVAPVVLNTLSLSGSLQIGGTATLTITGWTAGSTIASNIPGMGQPTFSAGAWTITGTPTGSATTINNGLVETLAGASNSPNPSAVTIAAAAGAPTLGVIEMTPQANPTAYPPAPAYTFIAQTNGYRVGDKVRIAEGPNFDRSGLRINDATYTLTGNLATDTAGLNAKLASISSGSGYIWVRAERPAESLIGDWSDPVQYGTAAVPALTSGPGFNVFSTFKLAASLTYSAPVRRLRIYGDDMIRFEVLNATVPGSGYVLRWLNDGTQAYSNTVINDFNQDRIYDIQIEVEALNGQVRRDAVTVTLLDYDTIPDAFTFTDVNGAPRSTPVEIETSVLAGMVAGYQIPIALSGSWTHVRVHNGTSWGAWQTSTTGLTVAAGGKVGVRLTSSASYFTETTVTLTLNGVSDTGIVKTEQDPSIVPVEYVHGDVVGIQNNGGEPALTGIPFNNLGLAVVAVTARQAPNYVKLGGVNMALVTSMINAEANIWVYTLPVTVLNNKNINVQFSGYVWSTAISYGTVTGADAVLAQLYPTAPGANGPGYGGSNPQNTDTLTVPTYGLAIGWLATYGGASISTSVNTGTTEIDKAEGLGGGEYAGLIMGRRSTTGVLSFNSSTVNNFGRAALVFKPQGS